MKYDGVEERQDGRKVEFRLACSKCGEPVAEWFIVCPKCGRKLFSIPKGLDGEKLCEMLTAVMREVGKRDIYRKYWGIGGGFGEVPAGEECGAKGGLK